MYTHLVIFLGARLTVCLAVDEAEAREDAQDHVLPVQLDVHRLGHLPVLNHEPDA
jgi:hypothetical protein